MRFHQQPIQFTWGRRGHGYIGTVVVIGFVCALASGCRGKNRESVTPVRGQVTYQGKGLAGAIVVFFPVDPANERAKKLRPFAYAENDGTFELKTYKNGDGAPPGKYRISVTAASAGGTTSKKDQPVDAPQPAGPAVLVPPEVAKKYSNVETSGIEVTIEEGENNLPPIELKGT